MSADVAGTSATRRIFFALRPNAAVRSQLLLWQRRLAPLLAEARAVSGNNLHLTLEFLGGLDAVQISSACQAADSVRAMSFRLELDHYAYLPRPRVAYAGLNNVPQAALDLHQQLHSALGRLGLPLEQRPWLPHVTLFRKAGSFTPVAPPSALCWEVEALSLMESCSTEQGVHYQALRHWSLDGGQGATGN